MTRESGEARGEARLAERVTTPRETLRAKVANWLWGYDYFISYHWKSGGSYAVALAQRLRNHHYDVFLDRAEYPMGVDWKEAGRRALRNTKRLVVVATREAVTQSEPVAHEVETFISRGRELIPIVFGSDDESIPGSIAGLEPLNYPVVRRIGGSRLYIREAPARLELGPTKGVIDQLTKTFGLVRRRDIRMAAVGVIITALAAFSSFATVSWVQALYDRNAAEVARNIALTARIAEQDQREKAELRAKVATVQQLSIRSQIAARDGDRPQALLLAATAVRHADRSVRIPAAIVPDAEQAAP